MSPKRLKLKALKISKKIKINLYIKKNGMNK